MTEEDGDRMEELKMDMAEALRSYLDESPSHIDYNVSWLSKRGWWWSDKDLCWKKVTDAVCTCKPTCLAGCKGECGCEYCREQYADFLSME
jgi:hypothetical protein